MKKILLLGMVGLLVGCNTEAKSYNVKCYSGGVEVFSANDNSIKDVVTSDMRTHVIYRNKDIVTITGMCVIKEGK